MLELPAGKPPHLSHLATTRIWRHEGHEECDPSHVSMHDTWNPCSHCGSTRISSPALNSVRQIAQSENLAADSVEAVSFGRDRRIFFFTPLLAEGGRGGGGREAVELEDPRKRRSQAQRATATRPRTHMRAQRRAARMTTKSEPTVAESGESAVDDELCSSRNLKGRVMWRERKGGWVCWWLRCGKD